MKKKAFGFIELMISLVIVGGVLTVALPNLVGYDDETNKAILRDNAGIFINTETAFFAAHGYFMPISKTSVRSFHTDIEGNKFDIALSKNNEVEIKPVICNNDRKGFLLLMTNKKLPGKEITYDSCEENKLGKVGSINPTFLSDYGFYDHYPVLEAQRESQAEYLEEKENETLEEELDTTTPDEEDYDPFDIPGEVETDSSTHECTGPYDSGEVTEGEGEGPGNSGNNGNNSGYNGNGNGNAYGNAPGEEEAVLVMLCYDQDNDLWYKKPVTEEEIDPLDEYLGYDIVHTNYSLSGYIISEASTLRHYWQTDSQKTPYYMDWLRGDFEISLQNASSITVNTDKTFEIRGTYNSFAFSNAYSSLDRRKFGGNYRKLDFNNGSGSNLVLTVAGKTAYLVNVTELDIDTPNTARFNGTWNNKYTWSSANGTILIKGNIIELYE